MDIIPDAKSDIRYMLWVWSSNHDG